MLESCLRNVKEDMSPTIVSPLLIMKKSTKHYQEDFYIGIPRWCPCSNCASFSLNLSPCLEAGSVETQCSKSSKQKWIEGYEAIKTTQQECTNNQMISYDINKPEIEKGKENIDNHFPCDTTVDELEKMIHQPTQLRTLIGHTKTLNHGVPPEISNFPKRNVQMMFLAQK